MALAAAFPFAWSCAAFGQGPGRGPLPADLVTSGTLSASQVAEVDAYAKEWVVQLASEDPLQVRRARKALQQPLDVPRVSARFRQEYSRALAPELQRLARNPRDLVVVNALVIAGDLATDAGVSILDQSFTDPRPAVRYEAVAGLGRTIDAIDRGGALESAAAMAILNRLAGAVIDEQDPFVVDRLVRSMMEATEVARGGYEALRAEGYLKITSSMSRKIRALGDARASSGVLESALRITGHLRDGLTAPGQQAMGSEQVKGAAALGGDLLAYVTDRLAKGDFPPVATGDDEAAAQAKRAQRALARELVANAETIIYFSLSSLGSSPTPTTLAADFERADANADTRFRDGAMRIFGRGGVLNSRPFDFAADRFFPRP